MTLRCGQRELGVSGTERSLFVNASQVVTCAGAGARARGARWRTPACATDVSPSPCVERHASRAVGPRVELSAVVPTGATTIDCSGGVLTPGFVDSHTHAIFGTRAVRGAGAARGGLDYMEIARRGGGIHSSVRDLRGRDRGRAVRARRAAAARGSRRHGVDDGRGEVGLRTHARRRAQVAARHPPARRARCRMRIVPTWLGAHEIPLEYRERQRRAARVRRSARPRDAPRRRAERLARFADVFCEPGVFTVDESASDPHRRARRRTAAQAPRRRADARRGGAELAAELGATSADHLAAISDDGIAALARAGTVATLLPGTMLFLGKTKQAPARALIDAGVRRRARDRLQSRHVADARTFRCPHARREPAAAVGRRSDHRRDGERRRRARRSPTASARSRRAFRPTSRCSTSTTCASCRTGTATSAASRVVGARQTLSPSMT